MGSGAGVMAVRNISTHIERKSQNAAKNVNEVNLSKTEKAEAWIMSRRHWLEDKESFLLLNFTMFFLQ